MLRVRVVVPAPHPAPPPAPGAGRGSVQFPHALQGAREQGTSGAGGQEAAAQGAVQSVAAKGQSERQALEQSLQAVEEGAAAAE